MTVRDTTLEAYRKIKASGRYATQKAAVFACVDLVEPGTRRQIASWTGFEISAVCGAVNKLIAEGKLIDWKLVECQTTGNRVHLVEIAPGQRELDL